MNLLLAGVSMINGVLTFLAGTTFILTSTIANHISTVNESGWGSAVVFIEPGWSGR